jgi:hypothetical protein
LRGNISYRELAKKYGVPFGTLRKVAAKEQWTQLRAQARAKADTKMIDAISDIESARAVSIIDVADKLLGKISDLMDAIPLDATTISTQAMKHLTSALKDLKEIKGFKSDADMREQEARIRNLERQAEADNNEVNEIKVIIEGDLENYSK